METTKEVEEIFKKCMEAIKNMGLSAREYIEQLNFLLEKLGEEYNETK